MPSAPQLAHLRDPFLWTGAHWSAQFPHCVWPHPRARPPGSTLAAGCTRINRPAVPTIYPPVAEAYFLALRYVTPVSAGSTPVQAAAGACAVLVTLVLLAGLRWLGRDLRWAALGMVPDGRPGGRQQRARGRAGGPAGGGGAAHLGQPNGGRRGALLGGTLLGLAIATKVTPVLVGPAVLRRRWWAVIAAAGSAIAVVYLPHVLAAGSRVVGFLPGYLQQEGYNSGQRFAIIGLFTSGRSAILIAVAVLAATGLAVLRFSDPDHPWRGAVAMTGVALAVTTPDYQWYAILLVMLVVLDGRPEWLAFAAGGYLAAEPHLGRWRVIHHSRRSGTGWPPSSWPSSGSSAWSSRATPAWFSRKSQCPAGRRGRPGRGRTGGRHDHGGCTGLHGQRQRQPVSGPGDVRSGDVRPRNPHQNGRHRRGERRHRTGGPDGPAAAETGAVRGHGRRQPAVSAPRPQEIIRPPRAGRGPFPADSGPRFSACSGDRSYRSVTCAAGTGPRRAGQGRLDA